MVHSIKDYQKFEDFSITPRRVQLTSGEDGDSMWLTSPNTLYDCRYHGYRIQNIDNMGGFQYEVWSMETGRKVDIPNFVSFSINDLKNWIEAHLPDLTLAIEMAIKVEEENAIKKAKADAEKKKAQKCKHPEYCGLSATTYNKVRAELKTNISDEKILALATEFVLKSKNHTKLLTKPHWGVIVGPYEEIAMSVGNLIHLGLIKINTLKQVVKQM